MVGLCASELTDGRRNLVSADYKQKQNKIVITDIQANQINEVFFLPMSDKSGLVDGPVCIFFFIFLWHLTIFRQMTIVRYVILVCCLLIYATIVFFSTQTAEVEFRLEHNF